jgi:hypothetical protein
MNLRTSVPVTTHTIMEPMNRDFASRNRLEVRFSVQKGRQRDPLDNADVIDCALTHDTVLVADILCDKQSLHQNGGARAYRTGSY